MNLQNRAMKMILGLALALPSVWSVTGGTTAAQAQGIDSPGPYILPIGTSNGKKVLFDNTHGETAGAADWVIDGGFSDFGNALANKGYYVQELRKAGSITYDDLKNYDVVVFGESNIPLKTSEQAALLQYVQNGGSIFFIADHYNADRNLNCWDPSEVFNGYRRGAWDDPMKEIDPGAAQAMQGVQSSDWLAQNFGVRYRYNAIGDIIADNVVTPDQSFGITKGVQTVAMHAGSTLAILDPTKAKGIVYLPQGTADHPLPKWGPAVDQGVYNGGGVAEGPMVAISKVGLGKAGFLSDSSPVEDATPKYLREDNQQAKITYAGFEEQNDSTLLTNMIDWLSTKESYTSLTNTGVQLDQPTQLYAFENPQTSTEPVPEPWGKPVAGYKWWDPSTFKAGSYGAIANVISDVDTAVTGNATPGETITATVTASGTTTTLGSTTVQQDGTYSLPISPLPDKATLKVVETDAQGNVTTSNTQTIFPKAPTMNPVLDTDTVVTGTAQPNQKVEIDRSFKKIASAVAGPDGHYTATLPAPQWGGTILSAVGYNAAGTTYSTETTLFVTDTTAPVAPTVNAVKDTDTVITGSTESLNKVIVSVGNQVLATRPAWGDGWFSITIPKQPGGTVISVTSTDPSGNTSQPTNVTVQDTTPPVTTAVTSSQPNANGWYNQDVTVTLNATDATGVQSTVYSLNGGTPTTYSGPFAISAEGVNTLQYDSTDIYGNVESPKTLTIQLDKTAPTVTVTQNGQAVQNVSIDTSVSYDMIATDALSGILSSGLSLDNQPIQNDTAISALTLGLGTHTLTATATDLAGNVTTQNVSFQVYTSFQAIQNLISQFGLAGDFKNAGAKQAVSAQLDNAQKQWANGHQDQAVQKLQDVQNTLSTFQANGNITSAAANVLNANIAYLLQNGLQ